MTVAGNICTATIGNGEATATATPMIATATTPVTFVSCVESGSIESQAVRLAASVRRWGGTFASCPFLAVTPRPGVPLRPETRQALTELEVVYIRENARGPYGWYKYMNKLGALRLAERYATTDVIVWLDADTLMLGEAPGFRLPDGDGLGACAAHSRGATTGPGDPNEPWWAAMCQAVGLRLEHLPWVTTLIDGKRVRLYFNAGVFAYRRSQGLCGEFHRCLCRILDAGAISRRMGVAFVQQAALSLAAMRLGLPYQTWPEPYNHNVGHGLEHYHNPVAIGRAHVLHYHNYMRPDAWPILMRLLQEARPPVVRWLSSFGPIHEPRLGGPRELCRSLFEAYRKLRTKWYETARAQCY